MPTESEDAVVICAALAYLVRAEMRREAEVEENRVARDAACEEASCRHYEEMSRSELWKRQFTGGERIYPDMELPSARGFADV